MPEAWYPSARRFVVGLLFWACADTMAATTLRIDVQGARGEKLAPHAHLLLSTWGEARRVALETEGSRVVLPLDPAWLRARWPGRAHDIDDAFVWIEAEGAAPIRSEAFLWLGARADLGGRRVEQVEIAFPHHAKVVVRAGEQPIVKLSLRPAGERVVQFVDDDGMPVADVNLRAHMVWSRKNRCDYLSGAQLLLETVSDAEGRAKVPAMDAPYALEFERRGYVFGQAPSFGVQTWITGLESDETKVVLRRLLERPLQLRVRRGGIPAAGEVLYAVAARCGCGACTGFLAQTDDRGEIDEGGFFPEEYERVFLEDRAGRRLWESDPRTWGKTGVVEVNLPADERRGAN